MAFDFVCPFCHSRTIIEDRFSGQSGPCAECGKKITLPSPASLAKLADELSDSESVSQKSRASWNFSSSNIQPARWLYNTNTIRFLVLSATVLVLFGVVGWLLAPAARRAFEDRRKMSSISNIQQIAKALNAYRRDYGSYPTPTVTSRDGFALYSWRVLLLPYLGYKDIYSRMQLDQPWDSPSNTLLLAEMPAVFAVAGNSMALSLYESNYSMVVGPGTLFPTASLNSVDDILDDPADTILIVESKEGGVVWMAPGNLDNSKGVRIGPVPATDIGGNFSNFVLVAMVDGSGVALSPNTPISTIQAMLTPDGGEVVGIEEFEWTGSN